MQVPLDQSVIQKAFEGDIKLRKRVLDAINETPKYGRLFEDIALYHETHRAQPSANGFGQDTESQASKKRKLENGVVPIMQADTQQGQKVILEVKDVSFSIPQRKKLHLEIVEVQDGRDGLVDASGKYMIRTKNPASGEYESAAQLDRFSHFLRLPVPEKAQKQYNFCLLPSSGLLPGENTGQPGSTTEPIIWTVNDGPVKSYTAQSPLGELLQQPEKVFDDSLNFALRAAGSVVTCPEEKEFASAISESHRKTEKTYHVKAFRGSKDGYLFFLKHGIFFGFKKPLLFFPFDSIESTSYTSVLQRTFNLNIAFKKPGNENQEEIEFSMIDQADFVGIDTYLKRHQLQDASMAEARRAKKLNINNGKKGAANGEELNPDEPSELEKAQQEMEDEEDEEEDYDPGSDGESDGSGSSGEDEDEFAEEEEGQNLVEEELGSEAEEVEPDSEDEEQL